MSDTQNTTNAKCPRCKGTGSIAIKNRVVLRCPKCNGTGRCTVSNGER